MTRAVLVLVAALALLGCERIIPSAHATGPGVLVAEAVHSGAAGTTGTFLRLQAFTFSCNADTDAGAGLELGGQDQITIQGAVDDNGADPDPVHEDMKFTSISCTNNNATAVYFGGADVNLGTRGVPICTTLATCPSGNTISVDARQGSLYCLADTATTITCLAGGT